MSIIIYHNGLFGLGSLDIIAISACDACPDLCSPIRNTRPTSAWYLPGACLPILFPREQWFIDWQQCGTRDYGFPRSRMYVPPNGRVPCLEQQRPVRCSRALPRSFSPSLSLIWPNDDSECRQQLRLIRQCPFDLCQVPAAEIFAENQITINHRSKIEDLRSKMDPIRGRGGGIRFPAIIFTHKLFVTHAKGKTICLMNTFLALRTHTRPANHDPQLRALWTAAAAAAARPARNLTRKCVTCTKVKRLRFYVQFTAPSSEIKHLEDHMWYTHWQILA